MPYGISETTWQRLLAWWQRSRKFSASSCLGPGAKGTASPGSDIDLAVDGPELTLQTVLRLRSVWRTSSIPYIVDVAAWDQIRDLEVRDHIARRG